MSNELSKEKRLWLHVHNTFLHVTDLSDEAHRLSRSKSDSCLQCKLGLDGEIPDCFKAGNADEIIAHHVEKRISNAALNSATTENHSQHATSNSHQAVWLLKYRSHPHEFYDALVQGDPLSACRDAMAARNLFCVLPNLGAKVFVKPHQWEAVLSCLDSLGMALRPYHVVVVDEYEHLVEESLQTIPFKRRPKIKLEGGRILLTKVPR